MASVLSGKQDYEHIAKKYSENNNIQIKLGQQFIAMLHLRFGQKVLDMGCGTGELTAHIARKVGVSNIFGVDPDHNRVEIATKTQKGISFTVGNSSGSFPHSNEEFYDVFLSNFVFHWLTREEKHEYFQRAANCLKPGGRLAIHSAGERPEAIEALLEIAVAADAMKPAPFFVEKAKVDSMFNEFGFKILSSENLSYEFRFANLMSFVAWTCATFYIDEPKISSLLDDKRLRKFVDGDGTVNFTHKAYRIIGRKFNAVKDEVILNLN